MINSGSYFIIFGAILIFYLLKFIVNVVAIACSRFRRARIIGIWAFEQSYIGSIWDASLKLFIESFFDVSMCVWLSCLSFMELPPNSSFGVLFTNKSDSMSTSLTLIYLVLIILIPLWGYIGIIKNFKVLDREKTKVTYGIFYSDNKIDTRERALYNIYFLARRFISVIILVFGGFWPYMQCVFLIVLSLMNCAYLISNTPMMTPKLNRIEIFNEMTILICANIMVLFLNIAMPFDLKDILGWTLMGCASFNIVVNLTITCYDSIKQAWD
jgi:hypothetical protein